MNATIGVAMWLAGVVVGVAGVAGCEAPNARPAQVPAQDVHVDDEDDDDGEPETWLTTDRPAPIPPVEYVKMSEWTPPPSVQELEVSVPPRGAVPPDYIRFPKLTKHSSIGSMHTRRH